MQVVTVKPLLHRGLECIGIYFEKNALLQQSIQKEAGARWSKTNTFWYIPCDEENYLRLKTALEDKAHLEVTALKEFLLDKKRKDAAAGVIKQREIVKTYEKNAIGQQPAQAVNSYRFPTNLAPENLKALNDFKRQLNLKSYSPSTIRTYTNEFAQFLSTIKSKSAADFTQDRIKDYLQYCFERLKLSENTLHSKMNALKFYYEQVLGRDKFFWSIPRPKKPLLLPKLLNEDELRKLFNALVNKKHKAMLFTAYSSGLRVSEIVNLKLADIDSGRMQMRVARAKGKKDRYVNLSPVLLDILRNYVLTYKPRPRIFLFESEQTHEAYPTRTIQQIFTNAKNKAGIKKEVGIHSLRHSFATHLLDKGTDMKYIKDILGHFNIKTTERYLHVSKERLVNIVSPFDDLWKSQGLEW